MSDRALVHRVAYDIVVPSRAVQVDPHVGFLGRPIGHYFFLVGRQKAALWLQNSQSGGLVGQECEDGSLKTEARVRFRAEAMAVPMCSDGVHYQSNKTQTK